MSTVESLQACMKQEDALITEFAAILEAETEVLVGPGDIDALHDITERKSGIAHKLVELSQTRDALLAEIGLPAGHAGTEQAAAQHPQLAGVWQALLSKSESANEINLRNGALIDVHLRYTQQSLDALRTGRRPASTSTYDAQGRAQLPGPQAHRRRLNAGSDAPSFSLPHCQRRASAAVGHLQHRVHLRSAIHARHAAGRRDPRPPRPTDHLRRRRMRQLPAGGGQLTGHQAWRASVGAIDGRQGLPGIGHVAETGLGLVLQHQPPRDRAGIGLRSRQIGQAEELRRHLAADRIDQARAHQSHRRFAGPARRSRCPRPRAPAARAAGHRTQARHVAGCPTGR